MTDGSRHSDSVDASSAGPDQIDALLAEAEALSAEIVSGTLDTISPTDSALAAENVAEEVGVSVEDVRPGPAILDVPDPIRATQSVQASVDELRDLLNDPDGKVESHRIIESNTGEEPFAVESSTSGVDVDAGQPPAATTKKKSRKGARFDLSMMQREAPPAPSIDPSAPPASPPSTSATNEKVTPGSVEQLGEVSQAESTERPGRSLIVFRIIDRTKSIAIGSVAAVRGLVILCLNAVLSVVSVMDWPFRSLSGEFKRAVGLCGIVTLVMGVAAWILPLLLDSNPFEGMETGIAVEASVSM